MKIEYTDDTAKIWLHAQRKPTYITNGNMMLPEPWQRTDAPIVLTFFWDEDGKLLGFEAVPASLILPAEALKK